VIKPNSGHSAIQLTYSNQWWPLRANRLSSFASKRLPPREDCEARAVCNANGGGGDDRDRTGDPLLAKQVLSQLSYAPNLETHPTWKPTWAKQDHPIHRHLAANTTGPHPDQNGRTALVGQGGFEPPTPRLSSVCSNQLSY
jgi:hypothetical protein